jgi:hypothetical protein
MPCSALLSPAHTPAQPEERPREHHRQRPQIAQFDPRAGPRPRRAGGRTRTRARALRVDCAPQSGDSGDSDVKSFIANASRVPTPVGTVGTCPHSGGDSRPKRPLMFA